MATFIREFCRCDRCGREVENPQSSAKTTVYAGLFAREDRGKPQSLGRVIKWDDLCEPCEEEVKAFFAPTKRIGA